jgi:molecular chaperone DnaK (HSP70)
MNFYFGVLCFFSIISSTICQILAIDFGTEFIKAAVVNKGAGKSFSIIEN